MKRFLRHLAGRNGAEFHFSMIQQKPGALDLKRCVNQYGTLDECYPWIERHSLRGYGVYCVINETDGSGNRETENIVAVRAVWNDCDDGIPEEYPLMPTMRVRTSVDKVQDYWLLKRQLPVAQHIQDWHAATLNTLVAKHMGDKGAKGLPRILRLPGSLNWKSGSPHPVTLEPMAMYAYSVRDIAEAFPRVETTKTAASRARGVDGLPASLSLSTSVRRYSLEEIAEALSYLSADDRSDWIDLGRALKRDFGVDGFEIWKQWAGTSKKYDPNDIQYRWDGLDVSGAGLGKITCGSIVRLAKAAGWSGVAPAFEVEAEENEPAKKVQWPDPKGAAADPNSGKNISAYLDAFKIQPWFNEFDQSVYLSTFPSTALALTDDTALDLRMKMHDAGLRCGKDLCIDRITWCAHQRSHHPIKIYLDGLKWDGNPRLDKWLHTIAGAENSRYHELVGSKFLIAAVKRARAPGCKFDCALVLEGKQGAFKSTLLRTIADIGGGDYFTDGVRVGIDAKEMIELMGGKWIGEMSELSGIAQKEVPEVKQSLSKQTDKARLAYGRFANEVKRQFVLAGTTNDAKYLRDKSGNRRFWCVTVGKIDIQKLIDEREQLWAEAAHREAQGERIHLVGDEHQLAAAEQAKREEDDVLEIAIDDLLSHHEEACVPKREVYKSLGHDNPNKGSGTIGPRVYAAMSRRGWVAIREKIGAERLWCFVKGASSAPAVLKYDEGSKVFRVK